MVSDADGPQAADGDPAGPETPGDSRDGESGAVGEPVSVSAASMAAEIAELKAELETLKGEADKRLEAWKRAQADLENYKRRSLQEMSERVRGAQAGLLLDLLTVVDDFERALAADHETDPEAWIEGVRLIEHKFYQFLEQKQLSPIAAEQQTFDPNFHEAVGQAPGPAGEIVAQLQKGYLLGDRVLRPARVLVGDGGEAAETPTDTDNGSQEPQ